MGSSYVGVMVTVKWKTSHVLLDYWTELKGSGGSRGGRLGQLPRAPREGGTKEGEQK